MGGVDDFGGATVEPDGYDQAIADAEAALADLKAKREEARKPKLPPEPTHYAAVIKQRNMVPAYKARGRWYYTTVPGEALRWEELMGRGGTELRVLFGY